MGGTEEGVSMCKEELSKAGTDNILMVLKQEGNQDTRRVEIYLDVCLNDSTYLKYIIHNFVCVHIHICLCKIMQTWFSELYFLLPS
jgi:hypothetical protein